MENRGVVNRTMAAFIWIQRTDLQQATREGKINIKNGRRSV